MPIYSIQAPNGRTYSIEGPEGASQDQIIAEIMRRDPSAGQAPKEAGILGSAVRGAEQMASSMRTGIASLGGEPNTGTNAALAGLQRQEEIQKKYPGQDAWEAVSGKYEKEGLLPAVGEYISRVPQALAEQAPQIATSMAGARVGAATPVPGGALVGAFTPSYLQQYGGFLERQAEEQKNAGQPVDVSRTRAALSAIPAAAIDVAQTMIPMGRGMIKAVFGEGVEKLLARGATKEAEAIAAKKLAEEGFLKTMGKGTVRGAAFEVPGEVTQAMIERAQAGLPLFDDAAQAEYGKTAFATTMLGPLGAAGRFQDKSAAKQVVAEEEAKVQREQRRAEEEAEAKRKADPAYAFEVEKKYLELEQQRKDLKAQRIKIDENSPTVAADKAFNKDLDKKIEDLGKNEINPAAKEYMSVKPLLNQYREQQRIEAMSPEEYMLEQTMQGAKQPSPKPTGGRMKGALGINEVPEAPAPDTSAQEYAQGQIDVARNMGQMDLPTYADYLMQDPAMAERLAKERPVLEGISKAEQAALYGSLKLRLKDREKESLERSKQELAQRQEDLKRQYHGPTVDQLGLFKESEEQVAEQRATAETNFDYLDPIFEKAVEGKPGVVAVPADVKPDDRAPAMRERINTLIKEADEADKSYRQARALKERPAASEAFTRRSAALKQLDALGAEGGTYAQNLIAARRAQETALGSLEETAQRLKSNEVLGKEDIASATVASLERRAAEARSQFITSALQEAALNRRAAGKQPLTQDEAIKAASDLYETVNDWMEAAGTQATAPEFEERIKTPAQMRANKLVKGAETERVQTTGGTRRITPEETAAYKKRIADVRDQLSEVPSAPTRAETILKPQFASTEAKKVAEAKGETATTLAGELRRHSEYTLTNLNKALARNDLPQGGIYEGVERGQPFVYRVEDMRELLEKARDVIEDGKSSRELLDAVDAQVERIMRGEDTGNMLVKRRELVSEKRVDETEVPKVRGEETDFVKGKPREGMRRKYATVGYEEERAPLSEYQQDIKDALAAAEPTALEQKEAGQKALFPETEADLGYIRMSPKNFANSPKIRTVWEALTKARALAKRKADKDLIVKNRSKAAGRTLERIQLEIDKIKADTKFFWANEKQWTNKQLAEAAIEYPTIGKTKEERELVDRYVHGLGKGMSAQEKQQAVSILSEYRTGELSEYKKRVDEAVRMLAQGERLEDLDNDLLRTMQDTNKIVRDHAARLRESLAPLNTAIGHIKAIGSKPGKKDALSAKITAVEKEADKAKDAYRARVKALYDAVHKRMDDSLAEILDPEIQKVSTALDKAQETLAKEKAELERIEKKVQDVLSQPEGKDRMQLATYEQFRYEEKKSIIEDLEKQIKAQQADLEDTLDTRTTAHDNAAAALQAVMDKQTKTLRDKIVRLENKLAEMRGESVTTTLRERNQVPVLKYPFAENKAKLEAELKAAKSQLKTAERQQVETVEQIKSAQQKVEEAWQKAGGFGKRRVEGKVETLVSTEQKRLDKMREEAYQAEDRAETARQKNDQKRVQIAQIDQGIADIVSELAGVDRLSDDPAVLRRIVENENSSDKDIVDATAKLGMLQDLTELEAQLAAVEEGRPRRKQQALTTDTTAKQAANKPFRTGDVEARSEREFQAMSRQEQREANEAAQAARGKKAAPEIVVQPTARSRALDAGIELDEYDNDLGGLFRTQTREGAGMNEQAVARLADKIMEGWEVVPEVKVVANESQLPDYIQEQIKRDKVEGNVPGLYDTKTGVVYLVASNLHNGNDVALTVAHEVSGHFGLRSMLGDKYASTMNGIYQGNEAVRTAADGKIDRNPNLTREVAVEEVLAEKAEEGKLAGSKFGNAVRRLMYALKQWFAQKLGIKNVSDAEVEQIVANARRFVKTGKGGQGGFVDTSGALYKVTASYANAEARDVAEGFDKFIAKNKTRTEKLRAAAGGFLGFETQLVDRFAPLERISKVMDALKGSQMMYYLRMYDQRMHFTSQAVSNGALARVEKTRADGQKEYVIESKPGASIKGVVQILKDAQPFVGNGEAVNRMFTAYMSAIRAKSKGFEALNFSEDVTEEDLRKAERFVEGNQDLKAIFDDARREYNDYNRDMMQFLADAGAISEQDRAELVRENDYIPWYREKNGVAELMIGSESRLRIGSIAEQPYLHELVGGDKPILDFMVSSVQNTNMLVDMGMRNIATKNAIYEMVNLKMAKIVGASQGTDIIKFKEDGQDKYAHVEGTAGIPGDLIVKGMEGIPTQMPGIFRIMGMPASLLRKAVTLSPMYAAKQLFRDSLAAPIMSGANFTPVIGALKQINQPTQQILERRGVTGGQQFTGAPEDLTMILREVADGKSGWQTALAKAEALGMEADALTRRAQYNSYIEQGLSEMEATLMSLESMNFSKRGASPSIHIIGSLIPFFNAQIQGLNVLYKSMTGNMPFNEKLKIQEKLLTRGAMLAAGTLAYTAMMQDDEAYKNATPDQKYGNWFVRIPGVDEPVRIPVPFEIGYIFKALPEALYNSMANERGGEEAAKAFKQILLQTIPGGTSYGIPAAIKPLIEVGLGKSFYTGRDILSEHEKGLLPQDQFRTNTSEAAKMFGNVTGVSPIMLEQLVQGYTGSMGLAFLQAVSTAVPTGNSPEKAVQRMSDRALIGSAFQPNDAGGIINDTYDRMESFMKVKRTVDNMMKSGRMAEAKELLQQTGNQYAAAEMANDFKTQMQQITQAERAIAAANLPAIEKRERLDSLRKLKISLAERVRRVADKTVPR